MNIIRRLIGFILSITGIIGFFLEISSGAPDSFGLILSVILIFSGCLLLFIFPRKIQKTSIPPEMPRPPSNGMNVISTAGIIFSGLTILAGLITIIFGGAVFSTLFSESESGWGLLGAGITVLGIVILMLGFIRLLGYILLKRRRYAGYITVLIIEILSALYLLFLSVEGGLILTFLPLFWSVFVVVYLLKNRQNRHGTASRTP